MRAHRAGVFCVVAIIAIALAACASSATKDPAAPGGAGDKSGKICRTETPTGSNFSREVCRTPEQMADDRKEADEMIRGYGAQPTIRGN